MKKNKVFSLLLVTLMFLFTFQLTAFAETQYDSASTSWTSENASYGPDDGNYTLTSWDYDPYVDRCKAITYVTYNSSNITSIANYYNNDDSFPGLDLTDINNRLDAKTVSSNFPDPHFDWDDDFPWTNGDEEVEVTCESPLSLSAGTQGSYSNTNID